MKDLECLGESKAMLRVKKDVAIVARSGLPVLFLGETGVGKEFLARRIHELSGRKFFVVVPCPNLQEALFESELFGHEQGAFTGAFSKKLGLCEVADQGTLFLDEVGDLPFGLQPKLLQFLNDGRGTRHEVRRLGATHERSLDNRVIVATNQNLEELVSLGKFRRDLLFRVNAFPVFVPPLRERKEDIPLLAETFLSEIASREKSQPLRFPLDALHLLIKHEWPGNVRELQNVIEVAHLLASNDGQREILPEHIKFNPVGSGIPSLREKEDVAPANLDLRKWNEILLREALRRTHGNRSAAAVLLGVCQKTVRDMCNKHHIPSSRRNAVVVSATTVVDS